MPNLRRHLPFDDKSACGVVSPCVVVSAISMVFFQNQYKKHSCVNLFFKKTNWTSMSSIPLLEDTFPSSAEAYKTKYSETKIMSH
jgi:hypothetical protein